MIDPRDPALNYVLVNGVRSPGQARLTGVKVPHIWDVIPLYGMGGARTIYRGVGIAKPTLSLFFWLPEHFLAWSAWQQLIKPPSLLKPLVVEMGHPMLAEAGIKAVGISELGQPEKTGALWIATIPLIEYRPPTPALVKPRGAIPSPSKGAPISPKTEAQKAAVEASAQLDAARARDNK